MNIAKVKVLMAWGGSLSLMLFWWCFLLSLERLESPWRCPKYSRPCVCVCVCVCAWVWVWVLVDGRVWVCVYAYVDSHHHQVMFTLQQEALIFLLLTAINTCICLFISGISVTLLWYVNLENKLVRRRDLMNVQMNVFQHFFFFSCRSLTRGWKMPFCCPDFRS